MYLQKQADSIKTIDRKEIIYWDGIKIELTDDSLTFYCPEENMKKVYKYLMNIYYGEIIEETPNERAYVSEDLNDVITAPKINRKSFAGRIKIDKLQEIYGVKEISYDKFTELAKKFSTKGKFWHGGNKKLEEELKIEKTKRVDIYVPPEKIKEILSKRVVDIKKSSKRCVVCGSPYTKLHMVDKEKDIIVDSQNMIYDFGYSPPINRDHRLKDEISLCFMCDFFYKMGVMNNYFYNNTLFISDLPSLRLLKSIKEQL
ncbi:MAG: hypothetical protein DRJ99_04290, partial [Thermoplasmata archaeon]